jgi:hypothetical protein
MATDQDRILDKIRKCLAVGNDERGDQTTRETALRQAYALMTKHNLDIAEVGSTEAQEKREEQRATMSVYPWARGIAHNIALLFFCSYFFARGRGKSATHSFVGKASNAITARELSEYVIASVFKELRARYGSDTSPEARNFATGVETAIRRRCNEMRAEAVQAAKGESSSRALVLVNLYDSEKAENEGWIKANVGGLAVAKDLTKRVGGDAYRSGIEHGKSINLSRQIGTANKGALRLK